MIPRKLIYRAHKDLVKQHLCSLQGNDRRLRFGVILPDDAICNYVDKAWAGLNNEWFGVVEDGKIIAAIHIAKETSTRVELGLSVNVEWRGHKLGQALFERAVVFLKANGIRDVFMHCLTENAIMKHIATKNHMKLCSEYGETDADLKLPPPTVFDPYQEILTEQLAIYDNSLRKFHNAFKHLVEV